jgi:alkaline phosphatase D
MNFNVRNLVILLLMLSGCEVEEPSLNSNPVSKIAFGSCAAPFTQPGEMDIFSTIHSKDPDLYIGIGDNMYADVEGLEGVPFYNVFIDFNYLLLNNDPHFRKLRRDVPIIATWDDHDYGKNNGGVEFQYKDASKQSFMEFYGISDDSEMHLRDGIYDAYYYGEADHRLQVLLLDTRWNLDVISPEPISPTNNSEKEILGEAQWEWLERELRKPASVRIIGSSTQFGIEPNGYESWANYPHEMDRMFDLIRQVDSEGVIFISGDVHYSEISRREMDGLYPIYDFTASGLTHAEGAAKPNEYRVGDAYVHRNFGMLEIEWNSQPVTITYNIYDVDGVVVNSFSINLDELRF